MSNSSTGNWEEQVSYTGTIVEVVELSQPGRKKKLEIARRGPGARILITDGKKILLTREYRRETKSFDLRVPGGKVFDTLAEWRAFKNGGIDIQVAATEAAGREALEEVGIRPNSLEFWSLSQCGATMEWDLYFFLCESWSDDQGQDLDEDEEIKPEWMPIGQALGAAISGEVSESRSAIEIVRIATRFGWTVAEPALR